MKLLLLTAVYAAHAALGSILGQRDTCADNCARAVTGTRLGSTHITQASADCASFFRAVHSSTVTPAVVTQTIISSIFTTFSTTSTIVSLGTETDTSITTTIATVVDTIFVTSTTILLTDAPVAKRTVVNGKSIPTYASACSNAAAYSSACSCFGLRSSTATIYSTLATPSTSTTVDTTSSAFETDTSTLQSTITTITSSTALIATTTSTESTVIATSLKSCQSPIVNPSFEEDNRIAIGWSVSSIFTEQKILNDPSDAQSGSNFLVYTDPFFEYYLSQTVTVCPALAYTLSFYVKYVGDCDDTCDATYCVGSTCTTVFNENFGSWVVQTVNFPGTTGGETNVHISLSFAIANPCSCDQMWVDSFSFVPLT